MHSGESCKKKTWNESKCLTWGIRVVNDFCHTGWFLGATRCWCSRFLGLHWPPSCILSGWNTVFKVTVFTFFTRRVSPSATTSTTATLNSSWSVFKSCLSFCSCFRSLGLLRFGWGAFVNRFTTFLAHKVFRDWQTFFQLSFELLYDHLW